MTQVIVIKEQDLSNKPPVTITYAAQWLNKHRKSIYDWIEKKSIKTVVVNGQRLIPFSELIRLDNAA